MSSTQPLVQQNLADAAFTVVASRYQTPPLPPECEALPWYSGADDIINRHNVTDAEREALAAVVKAVLTNQPLQQEWLGAVAPEILRPVVLGAMKLRHQLQVTRAAKGLHRNATLLKAGDRGPRAGHKYINREKKGNRWVYTYTGDPKKPGADATQMQASLDAASKTADAFRKAKGVAERIGQQASAGKPHFSADDHLQEAARLLHKQAKADAASGRALVSRPTSSDVAMHLLAHEHLAGGVAPAAEATPPKVTAPVEAPKTEPANASKDEQHRLAHEMAETFRRTGMDKMVVETVTGARPGATAAMHRQLADAHVDRMAIVANSDKPADKQIHADSRLKAAGHLLAAEHIDSHQAKPEPPAPPPPVVVPDKPKPKPKAKPRGKPKAHVGEDKKPTPAPAGATPRDEAAAEQKKSDVNEYEFARDSKFANKGEDLKNSARHKVNAWRGLAAAEEDGTAEKMVKRDVLLKADPPNFAQHLNASSYNAALVAHTVMQKLPPAPNGKKFGKEKEARADFVKAYSQIKTGLEGMVKAFANVDTGADMGDSARRTAADTVLRVIKGLRADDQYNPVANQLISTYRAITRRASDKSVTATMYQFDKLSQGLSGEQKQEAVAKILEGTDMHKAVGAEKPKGESRKDKDVDVAALYTKEAEREGPPVPGLKNIKGQEKMLLQTMGMRGLQWGNSVTDGEREHHIRLAAEAFHDLTRVLDLPEKMASYNDRLGLAIGARGHGTALAHYEPAERVINLTRKSGVGSLAHEWGHFFDNIVGELSDQGKMGFLTNTTDYGRDWNMPKTPLANAMQAVMRSPAMQSLEKRIQQDPVYRKMGTSRRNYWTSTIELWARSFEKHVEHKLAKRGEKNTYLAGVKDHPFWPNAEESAQLAPLFDAVFDAFKKSDMLNKALRLIATSSKDVSRGNSSSNLQKLFVPGRQDVTDHRITVYAERRNSR